MYGIADYWAFVFAIIVFLAIPGPGNLAIITSTSQDQLKGGLSSTFGVIVGDQLLLWAALAGVSTLLNTHPALFSAVQYLGASYLAYLGLKMIVAKPGETPVIKLQPRHYFRQSLFITVLNPKAIGFYMAFFPLFVDAQHHQGLQTFAVMALTVATLTFMYCSAVTLLTYFAAQYMRSRPLLISGLNKMAGTMLIGFSLKLALQK